MAAQLRRAKRLGLGAEHAEHADAFAQRLDGQLDLAPAIGRVVERELTAMVGDRLDKIIPAVEARLTTMGAALGPPWSEDYKLATLAAWLHLDEED